MKLSLNWLKDYVRITGSAESLAEKLTLAGLEVKKVESVQDDVVFETEVTTNRPDCLSYLGAAREIYAVLGGRFSLPPINHQLQRKNKRAAKVSIPPRDRDLCPYYSACLLEGVEWDETPDFMKKRLEVCGVRSINLPVDITNFVLLEWGQPLHAFDMDCIVGTEISARRARSGEKIVAIDGTTYPLATNDLVIADGSGPIAIGGVMGGKTCEVTNKTKNILLESAFFTPSSIRAISRRLKLASESSYRFERRVDPLGVDQARERAIYLFKKYAKVKQISPVFRAGKLPIKKCRISLPSSEVKRTLGVGFPVRESMSYLARLGLGVSRKGETIFASIPSFRSDLTRPIDLIEEIVRLVGYHRVPETLPQMIPLRPKVDFVLELPEKVRDLCVSLGFQETVTFSLIDPNLLARFSTGSAIEREWLGLEQSKWVRLVNPQNKEWTLMRPTLFSSILDAVRRNLHVGEANLRLFELSRRYLANAGKELPREELMLGIAASGLMRTNWLEKKRDSSFYDLKGFIDEFLDRLGITSYRIREIETSVFESGCGFMIEAGNTPIGCYGSVSDMVRKVFDFSQPVFYSELSLEALSSLVHRTTFVQDLPRFPSSPRDLTLIVPQKVRAENVRNRIRALGGNLVQQVELFDYFKGGKIPKDKKSLSFRIIYQAKDRTLQNEEVNTLHFSVIDSLVKEFNAELPQAS